MTIVATPVAMPSQGDALQVFGSMFQLLVTLAFSGSYATGGDPFDMGPFLTQGPNKVYCVDVSGGAGYAFEYDAVNKKLKLFSAPGTELAAGAYPAALTGDVNTVAQVFAR
jgi:hypothetical protein